MANNTTTYNRTLSNRTDAVTHAQKSLWGESILEENPEFLSQQLITYIGNKRSMLNAIDAAVAKVKYRLNKNRLRILDAFSGSGVVSRYFKGQAEYLVSNDIEDYATVISRCYLRNSSTVNIHTLRDIVHDLNERVDTEEFPMGFIEEMYAPRCENKIIKNDRVFYTRRNARRLDNYRRLLDTVSDEYRDLLLGPLLSGASIHANTSGVFKGFHKNRHSKIGQFGGTNSDALKRILGDIFLDIPVLSRSECEVDVLQGDTNRVAPQIRNLELVYLDPPYNQHPYGSNYFMLNLIVNYKRPDRVSRVSGIPVGWHRSDYNVRSRAKTCFFKLLQGLDTKFILISFNNEGFIPPSEMLDMLKAIGKVEVVEIGYNTFRGCRNLKNRDIHVTEQLFMVER
jgi:adenine-specific DNA-methyltransferase